MKTVNFFKSIIVMMVVFVTVSANAQNVVTGINTRDERACREYLDKNPQNTIVSVDSVKVGGVDCVVRRSVYLDEDNRLIAFNDTTSLSSGKRDNSDLVEAKERRRVVTSINTSDPQACGEYLVEHPQDTIVNVDSVKVDGVDRIVRHSVHLDEDNRLIASDDTLFVQTKTRKVVNPEIVKEVDKRFVDGRVANKIVGDQPRDNITLHSNDTKEYRDGENGDDSDKDSGKGILRSANKYGASVVAHAGYSIANGVNGPIAGLGVSYERRWWQIYLNGEVRNSKYSANAVKAGKNYLTFGAESALMIRPVQFDRYDQHRLFVQAGVGFEGGKTDSKPLLVDDVYSYLSSKGNYLYVTAGLSFESRFYGTGNAWGVRLQWRNTRATVQNSGDENFGSVALSFYFKFGVFRNRVRLK